MTSKSLDHIHVTRLKGVGPALAEKLQTIGIRNVQDLLFHLPLRYEDRTRISPIQSLHVGETAQVQGEIVDCRHAFGRRRSLQCTIFDKTGTIALRFFHFSAAQKAALKVGAQVRCFGEVRHGRAGYEFYHPEYRVIPSGIDEPLGDSLTPVYPATEGLQQGRLRSIIKQALGLLDAAGSVQDYLPTALGKQFGLSELTDAIRLIHRPPLDAPLSWANTGMNPGQRRLAFEELLAHRLCMRRFKSDCRLQKAPTLAPHSRLEQQFLQRLPFKLTQAQQRTFEEIAADLNKGTPMLRLLQGDVGSGKTVVAALAALQAIGAGYQVALMAPTEILAEQHLTNFQQWLTPLGVETGWLTGKIKGSARRKILDSLEAGTCQLLIGTHALFQEDVCYRQLGLIIIDEQHRFGVHQRLALREKAVQDDLNPHQLVMTATPIPRTLAMSAYADLDNSVIDELPPGRTPVNTVIVSSERRPQVIQRIEEACAAKNQAYWVCTLIEESDILQCQAAEVTAEQLAKQLPRIAVGLIHGRMKSAEKKTVMDAFKAGAIQLLVATTVIEVGVDVPNASLMIIENPERLGLAQLHQLRGRVGRGARESHCLLLYQSPLSQLAKQRLRVMRESNDGFYIAEKDLELRGPGQVLGTAQTGLMTFRIADLVRDAGLLDQVKDASELVLAQHADIIDPLIQRWLGERTLYVNV